MCGSKEGLAVLVFHLKISQTEKQCKNTYMYHSYIEEVYMYVPILDDVLTAVGCVVDGRGVKDAAAVQTFEAMANRASIIYSSMSYRLAFH